MINGHFEVKKIRTFPFSSVYLLGVLISVQICETSLIMLAFIPSLYLAIDCSFQ